MSPSRLISLTLMTYGLVLHTFTWTVKASYFSAGFWLLSLSPYIAAAILYFVFRKPHAAAGALILTALMDAGAYVFAFVAPQSSMAGRGLLVVPIWNILLLAPIGAGVGWWVGQRIAMTTDTLQRTPEESGAEPKQQRVQHSTRSLGGMRLDSATPEDCRAIAEVHVESWQRAYKGMLPEEYLASLSVDEREAMWRRMVEREPSHLVLARSDNQIVGFVAFGASRDEGTPTDRAEIWAIYVKPACWSTGAGRLLWLEALRRILAEAYKSISLWVIVGNERAVRFYERAGFAPEPGSRKSFEMGGTTLEELRYVRPAA
jgi:ribosomal protein S18 acetylase RimI-like enzyme